MSCPLPACLLVDWKMTSPIGTARHVFHVITSNLNSDVSIGTSMPSSLILAETQFPLSSIENEVVGPNVSILTVYSSWPVVLLEYNMY